MSVPKDNKKESPRMSNNNNYQKHIAWGFMVGDV